METYSKILGLAHLSPLAEKLHELEHAGTLDTIYIQSSDLARRRMRVRSQAGRDIAIALPRETSLSEGAVLQLNESRALVVRVEATRWLRVRPTDANAALRLGYHAGNLHWRVKFDEGELLIGVEQTPDIYLDRLSDFVADGTAQILGEEAGP